ncbi:hypothetical protein KEJ21_00590 [Candidatus Bathyarchaeota archaeon]|nr:hypothetical protein [Candidatus Bathyarchaeota archaeon]MBS7631164.1 hypothetical protein [Candidatus Bathyarchaeota archaeon]
MAEKIEEQQFKLRGLHYCRRYMNLVRYDAELCGICPFNGVQKARDQSSIASAT